MKRVFIVGVLLIFCFKVFSQNSKLSIDANYPIAIGNNFIAKNFKGIFDIGVKYDLLKINKFNLGVSANIGQSIYQSDISMKALMIKPRFNADITLGRLSPYAGIGYSIFYYDINTNVPDFDKTSDGLNFNIGLKVAIISRVYLNFMYDFIKLRPENDLDIPYNTNIQMLGVGVGINL